MGKRYVMLEWKDRGRACKYSLQHAIFRARWKEHTAVALAVVETPGHLYRPPFLQVIRVIKAMMMWNIAKKSAPSHSRPAFVELDSSLCQHDARLSLSYLRDIYVPPTKKMITFKQIILSTFTLACFKEEGSSYM